MIRSSTGVVPRNTNEPRGVTTEGYLEVKLLSESEQSLREDFQGCHYVSHFLVIKHCDVDFSVSTRNAISATELEVAPLETL